MLHEVTGSETVLLVMLFPQLAGLEILGAEDLGADGVRITARTRTAAAACRLCGRESSAGHDRYPRRLRGLPCGGRAVEVVVSVRRFRCLHQACPASTFAEQVPGLTAWYQRRTPGLRDLLERTALALAGRAGARLAAAAGAPASRHTLIRLVRALPDPVLGPVAVLGVDDAAVRKGRRYATVLVDMGTRDVIDLLEGRDGDVLADWLKAHPGTEVICRDRAGGYADGARQGAPGAVQVADRWHLYHNLCQHVGRAVARHCGCPPGPAPADPGPQQATGGGAAPGLREIRTRQRYAEVQILRGRGKGITLITRETGLSRNAVRRYYHARDVSELLAGIKGSLPSILDPCKPYLHRRWNDGCTNITRLHAEITGLGYKGSYPTTYAYLRQFGEAGTAPPPAPAPPKSRDLARWILSDPENLGDEETAGLAAARRHCPHLDALARHVTEFAKILTGLHGDRLDAWITAVNADDQPELHSFARGIKRDHDAVRNGLTLPWNSGAVEGNNCKIKHIKRIMYGRANFDLLRKMAILN